MRSYFTLLRLPYQLQLGPIFGWGYLMAGGRLTEWPELLRFALVFVIFHIGAFGGLTALNSFYDRDSGPIGGLWQPPPPPSKLWLFAWCVQLGGLLCLLFTGWKLVVVYGAILLLSLGYSHPRTRWKGNAWKSLLTVAIGQGVLDFLAGALTCQQVMWWSPLWWGMAGATLTVIGFYPLTQLYQVQDDTARGDRTLAAVLVASAGRGNVFRWAAIFLGCGSACNMVALCIAGQVADAVLLLIAGFLTLYSLRGWNLCSAPTPRYDFMRIHWLMRYSAIAFGCYILLRLVSGGIVRL